MAAFSAFCMNDRFDYLSSRTLFQGTEIRRYRPFGDAPVKGEFDTWGFVRNLVYGVVVAAVLMVAAVCTGGAALFVGGAIGAGVATAVISAADYSTGNVRSWEEAQRTIDSAAICGAVACLLSGATIFANPYADMAVKEVIESYAGMKTGILLRSFESIGMAPEERAVYIYDWKTLLLDFGVGTITGIGTGASVSH